MTVHELIETLSAYDPEAEIVIQDPHEMMMLYAIESFGFVPTRIGKTLAINAIYCSNRANDPKQRFTHI